MDAHGEPGASAPGGYPQKETPMHAKPQKEHEWLQKLIGEWTYESE